MAASLHEASQAAKALDPGSGNTECAQGEPEIRISPPPCQNAAENRAQQATVESEGPQESRGTFNYLSPNRSTDRAAGKNRDRDGDLPWTQTGFDEKDSDEHTKRGESAMTNDPDGTDTPLLPGVGDPFCRTARRKPDPSHMKQEEGED